MKSLNPQNKIILCNIHDEMGISLMFIIFTNANKKDVRFYKLYFDPVNIMELRKLS